MNPIIAVEDHVQAEARKVFPQPSIKIDTLPSAMNVELLKKLLLKGNGIYFAFLGGTPGITHVEGATVNGRFEAYVLVKHAGSLEKRRRGTTSLTGAYHVMAGLISNLNDSVVAGVGTLKFKGVDNLFSMQLEETLKAAMYSVKFEVANMPFDFQADLQGFDDFITFNAQYDVEPHEILEQHQQWLAEPPNHDDSKPDAQDTVTDLNQTQTN